MNEFKVGDKVKCVDDSGFGKRMPGVYIVSKTTSYFSDSMELEGENGSWSTNRFKLVESASTELRKGDKFDQGKPMMRFLTKEFLEATAKAQTYGANKYGPWNFQKGLETSALYDAAMRHLTAWYSGEENDPESKELHLGHAAANLNMLLWMLANKPEMDDRPSKKE